MTRQPLPSETQDVSDPQTTCLWYERLPLEKGQYIPGYELHIENMPRSEAIANGHYYCEQDN